MSVLLDLVLCMSNLYGKFCSFRPSPCKPGLADSGKKTPYCVKKMLGFLKVCLLKIRKADPLPQIYIIFCIS